MIPYVCSCCRKLLSGHVFDSSYLGIQNVVVKMVDKDINPLKHTLTDKNGDFALSLTTQDFYLIIAKAGFKTKYVHLKYRCEPFYIMLELEDPDCFVWGSLLFDEDKVPSCYVTLKNKYHEYKTCTDAHGRYFFQHVNMGCYMIEIKSNDYEIRRMKVRICTPFFNSIKQISLCKLAIGCTIHGLIRYQKTPVANIHVLLIDAKSNSCIAYTKSNYQGIYFFGNLSIGKYYIKAIGYCE